MRLSQIVARVSLVLSHLMLISREIFPLMVLPILRDIMLVPGNVTIIL